MLALGTPLLWWAACFALLYVLYRWLFKRDWRAGAIVCGVAAGYLPWFLYQERTIFLFYAVVFIPFLCLALAMMIGAILGPPGSSERRRIDRRGRRGRTRPAHRLELHLFLPALHGPADPQDRLAQPDVVRQLGVSGGRPRSRQRPRPARNDRATVRHLTVPGSRLAGLPVSHRVRWTFLCAYPRTRLWEGIGGMRREVKYGLIGGSVALVAGVVGGFTLFGGSDESSPQEVRSADAKPGDGAPKVKTGPLSAKEVHTTAQGFLTAWQSGDAAKAAELTDHPDVAKGALETFAKRAKFSKVTLTPGTPAGGKVPYTVAAQIDYKGTKAPISYGTSMTVERDTRTGKPRITWKPAVLHPGLAEGDELRTGEAEAPPIKAVDRNGAELTPQAHPALAGVLDNLRDKYGDKTNGKPGVELFIHRAKAAKASAQQPDKTLKELSKGTPGTLKTTLDAALQTAAEKAVKGKKSASAAAVKPSTGEILALANSPEKGFNLATQGSLAPGSTMKIVTSAMLMDKGMTVAGQGTPVPQVRDGRRLEVPEPRQVRDQARHLRAELRRVLQQRLHRTGEGPRGRRPDEGGPGRLRHRPQLADRHPHLRRRRPRAERRADGGVADRPGRRPDEPAQRRLARRDGPRRLLPPAVHRLAVARQPDAGQGAAHDEAGHRARPQVA